MRYLLLLAALLVAVPAYSQEVVVGKQVMKLPEDSRAYFTTLIYPPGDTATLNWFKTDPRLASLKSQTHVNIYSTSSVMYQTRYKKLFPVAPVVVVQRPDGVIVSKIVKPKSADALAMQLQDDISASCIFWRNRNRCNPSPSPAPSPEPDPILDEDSPDLDGQGAPVETQDDYFPIGLAVGGFFVGLVIGVGWKYYDTYYKAE